PRRDGDRGGAAPRGGGTGGTRARRRDRAAALPLPRRRRERHRRERDLPRVPCRDRRRPETDPVGGGRAGGGGSVVGADGGVGRAVRLQPVVLAAARRVAARPLSSFRRRGRPRPTP